MVDTKSGFTKKPKAKFHKVRWELDLSKLFEQYKHHLAVYVFIRTPDLIKSIIQEKPLPVLQREYEKLVWEAIEFLLPDNLDKPKVLNKVAFYETVDRICNLIDYCLEKQFEVLSCLRKGQQ